MRVRVFLRQPLFTTPIGAPGASASSSAGSVGTGNSGALAGSGHVPRNVGVVEGELVETTAFGVALKADAFFDETGRSLAGSAVALVLPAAKIDHVHVLG